MGGQAASRAEVYLWRSALVDVRLNASTALAVRHGQLTRGSRLQRRLELALMQDHEAIIVGSACHILHVIRSHVDRASLQVESTSLVGRLGRQVLREHALPWHHKRRRQMVYYRFSFNIDDAILILVQSVHSL